MDTSSLKKADTMNGMKGSKLQAAMMEEMDAELEESKDVSSQAPSQKSY